MGKDTIERISHGYVVQMIDPDTMECVDEDFHSIDTIWENDLGNGIAVCPELEEKYFPIFLKSQEEIKNEKLILEEVHNA